MKLQFRQIEGFVKSPPANVRAILVYGPDAGLMRERARTMAATVVKDINDPFNVSVLQAGPLIEDPARLGDEANAMSMMGGKRLVRIEDGRDGLSPMLKDYLASPNPNALIIIEAGELGPRSALRMLFEKLENAAAVPCYVEDERDIAGFARGLLQEQGYTIAPDALSWLASAITGDRQKARGEIEKLMTYMGANKQIAAADVQAACGDAGAQGFDNLVYAAAGSKPTEALRALHALLEEGTPPVAILRSLQSHFRRLHMTRARMDAGEPAEIAMKSLTPQIFFKQEAAFRTQLNRWPLPALETVMQRLFALEAQCKQTHSPAETLCSQALLAISAR
jgi:DNA polymerase III subunit delta